MEVMDVLKRKFSEVLKEFNSIRFNVTAIVMVVVLFIVTGFEFFSYYIIRDYNEKSVIGILLNQAKYNQELYINYLSDYSLDEIILEDKDQFYRNTTSQVQILDKNGLLVFDSLANGKMGKIIKTYDVEKAISGTYAYIKSKDEFSNEYLISLSYPLNDGQKQVGIMRLTTDLSAINKNVSSQMFVYLVFGIFIFLLAIILSAITSRRISDPVNKLINISHELANGSFNVKAPGFNVNELNKLAHTLNYMSENIIKKEDLKNEFISSISHELRTPLTSIKGWAITLQSKPIQSDADMLDQGLSIIEKESDRLSLMVEDLLNFSRLSSSTMKFEKRNVNIVELVHEVYTQMLPRSKKEKIEFVFESAFKYLPVYADVNRLKEVFINIIDNAIKFTQEHGNVKVEIDKFGTKIQISVIDNGEGIKEDEIDLVTTKFYKGSSSKSQTGLGLSICEEILKAHNSGLMIESTYKEGTKVTILMDMVQDEKET